MTTPTYHVIIPARYGSHRLPGKPLLDIAGKPLIRHVVECAKRTRACSVTVATDDARIAQAVQAFGGAVVMTSPAHPCGSDRIAEAVDELGFDDQEIIVNMQGDEPELPAILVDQVVQLLAGQPSASIATMAAPLDDVMQLDDPSVVKVITDRDGYALYFSRAAIPHTRDIDLSKRMSGLRRHLGIYAYYCGYLRRFATRAVCPPEQRECLEQLRALWYGEKIVCADALEIPAPGIDTPADLERIRRLMER